MSEALAISAANLDVIEKNLGSVADALTGVITDVSSVNTQVNNVENKVEGLNNELKNLVKEVRENSILTNARQSIMYNNDQIEKKYGYYDAVRRMTEGFLDSIEHSNIQKKTIKSLREQLIVNNPNYWLSNALSALSLWVLNDKENTDKEVHNSLKKDSVKTSIFFSLVNLKLGRENASINWLKYYLSRLNPYNLSSEFVTILDLVSSGKYGVVGKNIIIEKINEWISVLSKDSNVINTETYKWLDFISSYENNNINLPYIQNYTKDAQMVKNNLIITSSYESVLNSLQLINNDDNNSKQIDEILNNLIYEYEDKEKEFQRDNFRNKLILECNGDIAKAEELFKKQESIYSKEVNLLSLLTNIIMFKNEYKVSNETQRLALSLMKFNILGAYEVKNTNITEATLNVKLDDFTTVIGKDVDRNRIDNEIDTYLNNAFRDKDKSLYGLLFLINLASIIGMFITFKNKILFILILIIMAIGNIMLIYKMISQTTITKKAKKIKKDSFKATIDLILAEYTDYTNVLNNNKEKYIKLQNYLNSIDVSNYVKISNGRDINIGG